jgi:nicotinamide riboside kinase
MRIYFCGSHSSGKTTLCRYVSSKYNIPMLNEAARAILSEKELNIDSLRYDLDISDDYQTSVFKRQLDEEQKLSSFVSDRSLLDCLAYTAQHSRCLSNLINLPEVEPYVSSLRKQDSVIFYVRPSKATLKSDGVRETISWDGIVAIDSYIKFMLEMWQLHYFQINTDSMQERCKLIDSIISIFSLH